VFDFINSSLQAAKGLFIASSILGLDCFPGASIAAGNFPRCDADVAGVSFMDVPILAQILISLFTTLLLLHQHIDQRLVKKSAQGDKF
jgi:hypothetical protein